jgi:hypothetical protein
MGELVPRYDKCKGRGGECGKSGGLTVQCELHLLDDRAYCYYIDLFIFFQQLKWDLYSAEYRKG